MEKTITLQESQISTYLAFVNSDQESIKNAIEYRKDQLRIIEDEIKELEQRYRDNELTLLDIGFKSLTTTSSNGNGKKNGYSELDRMNLMLVANELKKHHYQSTGSWWQKIEYLFQIEQQVMSGSEILKHIYDREPELSQADKDEKKKVEVNVFTTLNYKAKKGILKRIEVGKEYKYGFNYWFENNKLKKEYMK